MGTNFYAENLVSHSRNGVMGMELSSELLKAFLVLLVTLILLELFGFDLGDP
jgi:hypothetical protein